MGFFMRVHEGKRVVALQQQPFDNLFGLVFGDGFAFCAFLQHALGTYS
jgi:hypothetical protein